MYPKYIYIHLNVSRHDALLNPVCCWMFGCTIHTSMDLYGEQSSYASWDHTAWHISYHMNDTDRSSPGEYSAHGGEGHSYILFYMNSGHNYIAFSSFQRYAKNKNCFNTPVADINLSVKQFRYQIRPHILLGLIWIQTVCKGHERSSKFSFQTREFSFRLETFGLLPAQFTSNNFWLLRGLKKWTMRRLLSKYA